MGNKNSKLNQSLHIQVKPKGNQSWIFTGRTDAEAEAPILSPPDAKNWLIGKDPDAGKDWEQGKKGSTEEEMVGWHHRLQKIVKDREAWRPWYCGVGLSWATEPTREGTGCRDRGEALKKQQHSLGDRSWFPLKGYTEQCLWGLPLAPPGNSLHN